MFYINIAYLFPTGKINLSLFQFVWDTLHVNKFLFFVLGLKNINLTLSIDKNLSLTSSTQIILIKNRPIYRINA